MVQSLPGPLATCVSTNHAARNFQPRLAPASLYADSLAACSHSSQPVTLKIALKQESRLHRMPSLPRSR